MLKSTAMRIGRQMEASIERQAELAGRIRDAAEEGCPFALAVQAALEDNCLPFPSTDITSIVKRALESVQIPPRRRGKSKLSRADVEVIRQAWAEGKFSQRMLAERYGVHYSAIHLIVKGKRWL